MRFFHKFFRKIKKEKPAVSVLAERLAARLGFPCRFFPGGTAYPEIEQAYRDALTRGGEAGFVPVLVRADEVLDDLLGQLKDEGYTPGGVLKNGADAEAGRRFLQKRLEQYLEDIGEDPGMTPGDFFGAYGGKPEKISRFSSLSDLQGRKAEILLCEVPARHPWEIAAYIPFGGWNECPAPADMVGVLRYWCEKYGAVPAVITGDTLELTVPVPVGASDAAELAGEHFAFSPDRVFQGTGTGTLSEVAESLKVSSVWYFWWD